MQKRLFTGLMTAATAALLAGCSKSSTSPSSLLSDAQVTSDVASTSGTAAATDVANLATNDDQVTAFPSAPAGSEQASDSLVITRSHVCYDSTGAAQGTCSATTTDSVVFHWTLNGQIGPDTNYRGAVFQANIHRTRNGTISHLLGTETYRIHNAVGTSNDTTSFTGTIGTRNAAESAVDSVVNIRFNLPRSSNPWPVSGQYIRNVSGTIKLTNPTDTIIKTYTRRVTVTSPADAEGNVVLTINGSTCNLNLVTRKVTSCS